MTILKDKVQEIEEELRANQEVVDKYDTAGIYAVYIEDKLVYIGKSRNMLCRLAQHIFYTQNLRWTKSHKYKVFNLAQVMGYNLRFDVLYYSSTLGEESDDEIGYKEGEYIRQYLPPLNYQIPCADDYHHFTINRTAKTISLLDILGEDK